MDIKLYRSAVSNVFAKNRLLVAIVAILAALLVFSQYNLIKAVKNQTVIIIPKGLDKTVSMKGGEFDTNYLIAMGSYVAQLYWSFVPQTVTGQYQQLAGFLTPEVAPPIRTALYDMADAYSKNEVTLSFIVTDIQVELQPERKIVINGWRTKHILKNPVEEVTKTAEIRYTAQNGAFKILSISEIQK